MTEITLEGRLQALIESARAAIGDKADGIIPDGRQKRIVLDLMSDSRLVLEALRRLDRNVCVIEPRDELRELCRQPVPLVLRSTLDPLDHVRWCVPPLFVHRLPPLDIEALLHSEPLPLPLPPIRFQPKKPKWGRVGKPGRDRNRETKARVLAEANIAKLKAAAVKSGRLDE